MKRDTIASLRAERDRLVQDNENMTRAAELRSARLAFVTGALDALEREVRRVGGFAYPEMQAASRDAVYALELEGKRERRRVEWVDRA